MANFLKPVVFNNLVSCFTAIAFTTGVIYLPQVHATNVNLNFRVINFGIKIEKIFEKIKRAIDKGETNKIVGYMFDMKTEVEQYTGKKIDINKQIDEFQKKARDKGHKIDDSYIKQIKEDFHRQKKKRKHRIFWFAKCAELEIPYSSIEADLNFDMNNVLAKAANGHGKEIDVPVPIVVGVTVGLCGLFLVFVPIPGSQTVGVWLINSAVGILSGEAIHQWDLYDREQKRK